MFMADLIGLLVAAGGPSRLPLRASWTLHRAVGELGERARQLDGYGCLPEIHVASDSQVGTAVTGIAVGREVIKGVHRLYFATRDAMLITGFRPQD